MHRIKGTIPVKLLTTTSYEQPKKIHRRPQEVAPMSSSPGSAFFGEGGF